MTAPADPTSHILAILCEDSREPLRTRLGRAGITPEDLGAFLGTPGAERAVWEAASRRYLLPLIPTIIRSLSDQAAKGSFEAQRLILGLLGADSPYRARLGLDLSALPDGALKRWAEQLGEQLQRVAKP